MLERASLFLLGGGAYAALELAWRGTTHWTMFLTGGVCLCLLQALADRPLPLGPAAAVGADGAIIECCVSPENAVCDGEQAITPEELKEIISAAAKVKEAAEKNGEASR